MDVDAVEEGAADFGDVALDHGWGAHALARLVVEVAAGAGVHGGGEHEAGGEAEGHGGAGDGDHAVLKGLAENFEDVAGELGEFVEEEEAVVGKGDFAGARDHAAADEAGIGDGVVGRTEGAVGDETFVAIQDAGDGMDLGGLEGLLKTQRREDGGEAFGEHGFAGARRPDHKDVVATGGCHL